MASELLVLADTHLKPNTLSRMPSAVWMAAEQATAILHAGDVVCDELLDELAAMAPLHAVLGNNDIAAINAGEVGEGRIETLPDTLVITVEGVEIAMVHDSGARKGRENRMQRCFPGSDVVVFGHSHEPVNVRTEHDQLLFNPGSPTQSRRQPHPSFGWLRIDLGEITSEIVTL